jgi:hypothetical protein
MAHRSMPTMRVRMNAYGVKNFPCMEGRIYYAWWRYGCHHQGLIRVFRWEGYIETYSIAFWDILPLEEPKPAPVYGSMHQPVCE